MSDSQPRPEKREDGGGAGGGGTAVGTEPGGSEAADGSRAESGVRDGVKGRITGRNAAIAGGAVALVAVVAGAYFAFGGSEGPRHKLTTPKVLAGEYQRDGKGEKGDGEAFDNKKVPGMTSEADVSAQYKSGATKKLQLGGAYGSVDDPGKAVDWVFEQTGKSLKTETGAKAEGELREFSPSAFDGDVLKCQEYKISNMSLAMCGWADSSTVGTVSSMILTDDGTSTKPVDLKSTAELTAKVRKDALVEAG